jgi:hypothetical protein
MEPRRLSSAAYAGADEDATLTCLHATEERSPNAELDRVRATWVEGEATRSACNGAR